MTFRNIALVFAVFIAGVALFLLFPADESAQDGASSRQPPPSAPTLSPPPSQSPEPGRAALNEPHQPAKPAELRPELKKAPPPTAREPVGPSPGSHFDDKLLADLGYPREEIQFIRRLWKTAVEEEAALFDRSPEKWVPHDQRVAVIREASRIDLGDESYDAMLYATSQPNRAQIGNVIRTSAGAAAGLRIRDIVIRYDGERVFAPEDIKRLSEGVDAQDEVELHIRRDGRDIKLLIQGGPLGVRYFPGSGTPAEY